MIKYEILFLLVARLLKKTDLWEDKILSGKFQLTKIQNPSPQFKSYQHPQSPLQLWISRNTMLISIIVVLVPLMFCLLLNEAKD